MTRGTRVIFLGFKRSPLSFLGLIMIGFFVVVAVAAPILAPPELGQDPYIAPHEGISYYVFPVPTFPSPEHPFGELNGCDLYYGCIWGTRTAFQVALLAIVIQLVVGLSIGCIAGYFGGVIDELMMRLTDIFFAFPGLLLALIFIVAMPGEWVVNLGPLNLSVTFSPMQKIAVAIALTGWPLYARLIRGEVIKVKSGDYVEAAKAIGCSDFRVATKHILPNAIYPVLIMASLNIGSIVLSAATLSFLGFGPGGRYSPELRCYAEWGTIISNTRRFLFWSTTEPFKYIHTLLFPGVFLSTFVLGWSLIGDALRNLTDPLLRR